MTMPTTLVGTWDNGVFALTADGIRKEHSGQSVTGLARARDGAALAIIGGKSLCRRDPDGKWQTIATSDLGLVCCVAVGPSIYAGTDDAQVLEVKGHSFERLEGFERVAGRDQWYAGTALIDGRVVGPPLGIRSMTATCDHAAILANVHVGGIPRSADRGVTWRPSIDIDADVHQVCAHPTRADIVIGAAASGLCVSRDGGSTWNIEQEGMHTSYCSAVGFVGDDILVSASTDPFAAQGAVYRRPLDAHQSPLRRAGGGLPHWFEGRVDTDNIVAHGTMAAIADGAGNLYLSEDAGRTWLHRERLGSPSGIFIY
jgi:hypothetical protein